MYTWLTSSPTYLPIGSTIPNVTTNSFHPSDGTYHPSADDCVILSEQNPSVVDLHFDYIVELVNISVLAVYG